MFGFVIREPGGGNKLVLAAVQPPAHGLDRHPQGGGLLNGHPNGRVRLSQSFAVGLHGRILERLDDRVNADRTTICSGHNIVWVGALFLPPPVPRTPRGRAEAHYYSPGQRRASTKAASVIAGAVLARTRRGPGSGAGQACRPRASGSPWPVGAGSPREGCRALSRVWVLRRPPRRR